MFGVVRQVAGDLRGIVGADWGVRPQTGGQLHGVVAQVGHRQPPGAILLRHHPDKLADGPGTGDQYLTSGHIAGPPDPVHSDGEGFEQSRLFE